MMYVMSGAISMLNKTVYIITCLMIWVMLPFAMVVVAFKAALAYVDDALVTIHNSHSGSILK